ncbi:E3 ubiquitin-protein ligase TRIM39-like isoform X2 [Pleurodeles waltl]|uniref:E3 ubiquitin-protein ligase TRIM39-like isoform X2 n=1 Tax=Pleurodeles waltl TaxID=8319 RepID=UPI003709BB6D
MDAANQLRGLKEEATCSICLEYFTDPVSVECGHVFCLSCITRCWEGLETDFPCPQCRETSPNKTFRPIRQLANVADIAKQLHIPSATTQEENLCRVHEEKLKLFCEDDQEPICVICRESRDHKTHSVLPIPEASQEYKKTLQSHMERLKIELEHLKACAAEETKMMSELEGKFRNQTEKIVNTFELLNQFLEKEKEQLLCKLKEEHEEIMRKIRGKLTELEKQQSTHRDLITEIDGQCQQPDVQLLKNVQSILIRCNNLKAQEPQENAVVEQTLKCIGQHASLQEKLLELKTTFPVELEWRYIKASACSVTLDPDTAHRKLVVSVDGKSVIRGNRSQYLLDSPQRFDPALIVLGRERLSSGRHYWEVEVGNKTRWILGVCDEAVSRKGKITRTPKNGYWMVWLRDGKYEVNTFISTLLTPCVVPKTIGLFLDYEAGRLSLYNVDDRSLLFTFSTTSFPPTLRPFFNPHSKYGGRNAGGLRILTVSRFELKDETVRCSRKRSSL